MAQDKFDYLALALMFTVVYKSPLGAFILVTFESVVTVRTRKNDRLKVLFILQHDSLIDANFSLSVS